MMLGNMREPGCGLRYPERYSPNRMSASLLRHRMRCGVNEAHHAYAVLAAVDFHKRVF
jgi:hypothetical protein